jgi:methionyl aminopeptidase
MIIYKSPDEIERMRLAGDIVAETVRRVLAVVGPGKTTADLDGVAEECIREMGGAPSFKGYRGFPATICASLNQEIVHGIPSRKRVLRPGDVLSLDFGAVWEGFHADAAVTVFVGGRPPDPETGKLVRATREALDAAIEVIRPGARLSDIGAAIQQVAEGAGFDLVKEYGGHGIGRSLHEDPFISNMGPPGRGPELRPGLVVAVEPMAALGSADTRVLADDWTVVTRDGSISAHFEHTVAVTDDGRDVLTSPART